MLKVTFAVLNLCNTRNSGNIARFIARRYASAVYAVDVCPSVRLSVTRWSFSSAIFRICGRTHGPSASAVLLVVLRLYIVRLIFVLIDFIFFCRRIK